jgi:hypothetical protein
MPGMELLMVAQAGEMITGNGQLEYRGYVLGDDENTFMDAITGWDDLPGVESANTPRSNSHGAWVGRKLAGQRVITWNGRFSPTRPELWEDELRRLREAFSLPLGTEEYPIVVQSIGERRLCFGAVVARSIPMDRAYGYYGASVALQFECSDPRRYSLSEKSWTLELPPNIDTGLEYPLTYPLDYGIEITSNEGTLFNDGDVVTPVTLFFSGPVVRPSLVNKTANTKLEFNINLSADETLEVNTRTGTVLLNGVADRIYTRTSNSAPLLSFGLMPGYNEMVITAEEWDTPASVSIAWRDATL